MRMIIAMGWLIIACGIQTPVMAHAESSQSSEKQVHVITGTLEELDLSTMKGMIKTDLGKPVFFEITKPELFKGLSVGERVSVQVDDKGRAMKVIDMPVPELKKPLN
jgi:hypothetical protein